MIVARVPKTSTTNLRYLVSEIHGREIALDGGWWSVRDRDTDEELKSGDLVVGNSSPDAFGRPHPQIIIELNPSMLDVGEYDLVIRYFFRGSNDYETLRLVVEE